MSRWPLGALLRLRSAQARSAVREAAAGWSGAIRARNAAEDLSRRAAEERDEAASGKVPPSAGAAGDLARDASCRRAIDQAARRTRRQGERAAAEAERAMRRAVEADSAAGALRGRVEALERGRDRWERVRRLAREARREREVEEAWGALAQLEAGPSLAALDLQPPGTEVAGRRLAAPVELGRGDHHLLAWAQRSQLVLPGPIEREHHVRPDLVGLVAHQDLLPAEQGVLEDVDVGADRVARAGGGAGDPEGQEGSEEPAAHHAEAGPLPAPGLPEALDQVRRRPAPLVERPPDEAWSALRSISHGGSLQSVRGIANVLRFPHRPCAEGTDGV